jgi:hypothetical protein
MKSKFARVLLTFLVISTAIFILTLPPIAFGSDLPNTIGCEDNNADCEPNAESSDLSNVTYMGRFDFSDPQGPQFSWSASTLKANFTGTSIGIKLKRFNSWHDNYIGAVVDGGELIKIKVAEDGTFDIQSELSNATHTIEIIKMDEGMSGDLQFLGFEIENGKLLQPPPESERKIEFIGDSITCGYGIETDDPETEWDSSLCNTYKAYPAITARALDADFTTICWSGTGVYRTWEEDMENVMPVQYWRTLSKDPENLWEFEGKDPQILIINLHTNDFSPGIPDRGAFTDAYKNFIKKIRVEYPETYIYCVVGGMISGEKLESARKYIQNGVVEKLKTDGDDNIGYFEFSEHKEEYGYGGSWHPSAIQHQAMADELVERIKEDFNW